MRGPATNPHVYTDLRENPTFNPLTKIGLCWFEVRGDYPTRNSVSEREREGILYLTGS